MKIRLSRPESVLQAIMEDHRGFNSTRLAPDDADIFYGVVWLRLQVYINKANLALAKVRGSLHVQYTKRQYLIYFRKLLKK